MRLSPLQHFILEQAYWNGVKRLGRRGLFRFYDKIKNPPKKEDQQGIITKSLERLIDRELVSGYGVRTPHKWYIKEIKLTPKGRKIVRKLRGEQQRLPLNS